MNSRRIMARSRRNGLSLLEVVFSTLLVGMVLVGALRCAAGVIVGRVHCSDAARGALLAQAMLAESVVEPYEDEGASPVFGLETGEPAATRLLFDDVDDYHGWSSSPPRDRAGLAYPGFDGWQRQVTVQWVQPSNPAVPVATDQGLKRVTVTVSRNGKVLAEARALRSIKYTPE